MEADQTPPKPTTADSSLTAGEDRVLVVLDVIQAQLRSAVATGDGVTVRRLQAGLAALLAPIPDSGLPAAPRALDGSGSSSTAPIQF